jgi:putative nucleotidyltransferase with HDIG domain
LLGEIPQGRGCKMPELFYPSYCEMQLDFITNEPNTSQCFQLIKDFDDGVAEHCKRVAKYWIDIMHDDSRQKIKRSPDYVNDGIRGGLLHDIGKPFVKNGKYLVNKPSPLTYDEYQDMQQHVPLGIQVLRRYNYPRHLVYGVVGGHHERKQNPYPRKRFGISTKDKLMPNSVVNSGFLYTLQSANSLPPIDCRRDFLTYRQQGTARMLADCIGAIDVFDSITFPRPYNEPVTDPVEAKSKIMNDFTGEEEFVDRLVERMKPRPSYFVLDLPISARNDPSLA